MILLFELQSYIISYFSFMIQERSFTSQSSFGNESLPSLGSYQPSSTIHGLENALQQMNAAIGSFDHGSISKIAEDVSSNDSEMSSLSSHVSSDFDGENPEHVPQLLPPLPNSPNVENMTDEERRKHLHQLIAAGQWDAVAAQAAMYDSDESSASSKVIISVSSASESPKINKKRSFLDYVVGKHKSSAHSSESEGNCSFIFVIFHIMKILYFSSLFTITFHHQKQTFKQL